MNRREMLKLGLLAGSSLFLNYAGIRMGNALANDPRARVAHDGEDHTSGSGDGDLPAIMPVSPFILAPFTDVLPIPGPLAQSDPSTWSEAPDPMHHQIWKDPAAYYKVPLLVAGHSFTSSLVRKPDNSTSSLPDSTIYGFNGHFPGPMIRAFYGKPVLFRIENRLDENPLNLNRGDFGVETFLTHLHNGHTAPESDGNPNHTAMAGHSGSGHSSMAYMPGEHCDNLYLNWPPDGDDREKQSFLWYHDHTMHNTATNVCKGMVGLYTIYDDKDCGDETRGYRLPGFDYDIPLAFYDCILDDGLALHTGMNQDGQAHPENWGKLFFGHYPNHGFVGDVFTVNGKVQPYLPVKRRKYRLRFLDCSIARWYEFKLMKGSVQAAAPGVQGQYLLANAEQVMTFTQVAGQGGLLPHPLVRDSIKIAPAVRKEVIIDFTQYADGSPTQNGDEIFLTNTLMMTDGRKPDDIQMPEYIVPMLKFIIDGDPDMPDLSIVPPNLRELPPVPANVDSLPRREFLLHRSNDMWLINDSEFDPERPLARPEKGSAEVWVFENGGGGWVHPMHIHQEEHQILWRDGQPPQPDDIVKDDVVSLEPGETVAIYRKFRSFTGRYVAHCHNLSHEDHAMMFGWEIVDPT